eukprot:NODE_2645_length_1529_cov_34.921053_g2281_i0.p1 GENE.NODE_2645_length_1529_cov_34.921053_g2281_i0~~NODE_2645_length_1529_cov_34.921053_g2281_i0.p1  ORF type:complete len:375 (+),score=92.01 NODE_2645_length_1529_cov_34.921053_g2281_i0:118-1242(+)
MLQRLNLKLSSADLNPSPKYSENIGLGSTGLGPSCNAILDHDRENFIQEYIKKREQSNIMKEREEQIRQAKLRKMAKNKPAKTTNEEVKETWKAIKEKQVAAMIAERMALEEKKKEETELLLQERKNAVEAERNEERRRKQMARRRREEEDRRNRELIQAHFKDLKDTYIREMETTKQEVESKHKWLRDIRDASKKYAESEKSFRMQKEKESIHYEKEKLHKKMEERKQILVDILSQKQLDIRNDKKEKSKRQKKQEEIQAKEHEQFREMVNQERQRMQRIVSDRDSYIIEKNKNKVSRRKEEIEQARAASAMERSIYLQSVRSAITSPSGKHSPTHHDASYVTSSRIPHNVSWISGRASAVSSPSRPENIDLS